MELFWFTSYGFRQLLFKEFCKGKSSEEQLKLRNLQLNSPKKKSSIKKAPSPIKKPVFYHESDVDHEEAEDQPKEFTVMVADFFVQLGPPPTGSPSQPLFTNQAIFAEKSKATEQAQASSTPCYTTSSTAHYSDW